MTVKDLLAKIGKPVRERVEAMDQKAQAEEKPSKWASDEFLLYRYWMDIKYQRVGLTTITWQGEEYGYRMDIERIPKAQLDDLRRSTPSPVHKSDNGWNEWVMIRDDSMTEFPKVHEPGDSYYEPTAIDLDMYLKQHDLDEALTFKRKKQVPIDGKMLLLCVVGVAVLAFVLLGMFS